jgi:hypothetical protein
MNVVGAGLWGWGVPLLLLLEAEVPLLLFLEAGVPLLLFFLPQRRSHILQAPSLFPKAFGSNDRLAPVALLQTADIYVEF